jgi:hypothetical protein
MRLPVFGCSVSLGNFPQYGVIGNYEANPPEAILSNDDLHSATPN